MYLYVLTNHSIMIGQHEPLISPGRGTHESFSKSARFMSRTARDLTRTSAFDALYYDVRARFIVVASRRVRRCLRRERRRRRRRATHRVVDDRAHTHNPETVVVVVVVSPRIAGLRHSRHTVVIAHRQTFIHSLKPPGAVVRALD